MVERCLSPLLVTVIAAIVRRFSSRRWGIIYNSLTLSIIPLFDLENYNVADRVLRLFVDGMADNKNHSQGLLGWIGKSNRHDEVA
ncbi:MAG: hypothetical protein IKS83_01170 [Victivallales bacterium]|nr:hypothetical protein [Victivallales bacterium]